MGSGSVDRLDNDRPTAADEAKEIESAKTTDEAPAAHLFCRSSWSDGDASGVHPTVFDISDLRGSFTSSIALDRSSKMDPHRSARIKRTDKPVVSDT